jgi:hypothetical protein
MGLDGVRQITDANAASLSVLTEDPDAGSAVRWRRLCSSFAAGSSGCSQTAHVMLARSSAPPDQHHLRVDRRTRWITWCEGDSLDGD